MRLGWALGLAGACCALVLLWLVTRSHPADGPPAPPTSLVPVPAPSPRVSPRPRRPEGAPAACHDASLTAVEVPIARAIGQPETLGGGALRDGAYDVVSYEVFGTFDVESIGSAFRQTLHVERDGHVAKMVRVGRQGTAETTTWNLEAEGSELVLLGVCPDGVVGTTERVTFSATDDEVRFGFEQAGVPVVVTYRRRRSAE